MFRKTFTAVALSIAAISAAAAQTAPATTGTTAPTPPAAINATALESGANSFTEGQARARLEQAGVTGIGELKKDDQGIWRGRATRNGAAVTVGVDFRGNVRAE
ncbi:PepSY domain-containing protein [Phreatobacter stygius]|uniref:PepSY domain-containing protein n=1 Tax=Phreatobacter stygius TaxID=1940610 RepID=A0A4D7BCT7_9HYPH|nr:PepSY domain-containing protein [Phreatobacter stygius]QCI68495.1 PepSY domain-containing protein [Phreatobacter stygius]